MERCETCTGCGRPVPPPGEGQLAKRPPGPRTRAWETRPAARTLREPVGRQGATPARPWTAGNQRSAQAAAHYSQTWEGLGGSYARTARFTETFVAGMSRDSTLHAATREKYLKETEDYRRQRLLMERMQRLEDFHGRMISEIGHLRLKEERIIERRKRREAMLREQQRSREESRSVRIQAFLRGAKTRRKYKKVLSDNAQRGPCYFYANGEPVDLTKRSNSFRHLITTRALTLQNRVRIMLARRELARRKNAASVLHQFFRERLRKNEKARFQKALDRLQAACRGYLVRQQMDDKDDDDDNDDDDDDDDDDEGHAAASGNNGGKGGSMRSGKGKTALRAQGAGNGASVRSYNARSRGTRHQESGEGDAAIGRESVTSAGWRKQKPRSKRKVRVSNPHVQRARETRKARKQAALSLQRTYRGFRARKSNAREHVDEASSARPKRQKSPTAPPKEELEEKRAAQSIQKHFRQHRASRLGGSAASGGGSAASGGAGAGAGAGSAGASEGAQPSMYSSKKVRNKANHSSMRARSRGSAGESNATKTAPGDTKPSPARKRKSYETGHHKARHAGQSAAAAAAAAAAAEEEDEEYADDFEDAESD